MPPLSSPIRDWLTRPHGLAPRLRDLRTRAGVNGKELAERLGWPAAKVSRFENGVRTPTANDLRAWAGACGDPEAADDLLDLLTEAQSAQLDWKRRYRQGQAAAQAGYIELVERSSVICNFQVAYVPGLLQVPDYARRVLSEMQELHGSEVDDSDEAVTKRLERQRFLYDMSKRFEFIVTEAVLRWRLCPPAVMHAQLDRLQTAIDLPNVRFGVVPFARQLTTTPQTAFTLYDDIAKVETPLGESTHTGDHSAFYVRLMERMWAETARGEEARRLILRAADELRR